MTVVVVCVLVAGCVVFAPAWLVRHDVGVGGASALSAGDRLKAVNDVRSTLLQALAGVVALGGVGLGALMTLRQIRVNREGQFIDLFNKAVEQLASDQVGVRHGGVYAMERIAEAVPQYRGHIAALLASFVRQQAPWPPIRPLKEVDAERQRFHGGLRDDIGGAMGALGRRSMIGPGDSIELEKVDLRGAELGGMDLSDFCFTGANLDGADLAGSDLSRAILAGASLRNADLTGTRLDGVDLTSVDLTGATGIPADQKEARQGASPDPVASA
ncbi:pentapeptide repeat-containing protein [Catenulispora yoronensis]|uniref:pentapeptide repeat-containing protein n=1 Tax=Catenulispora yoronensis TaxID=450799 RepID=UPI0031DD6013